MSGCGGECPHCEPRPSVVRRAAAWVGEVVSSLLAWALVSFLFWLDDVDCEGCGNHHCGDPTCTEAHP